MRYFIELSYDGTAYCGWQVQPNGESVQGTLQRALSLLLREEVPVTGAGRTDAGVHAAMMVAHFDVDKTEIKYDPSKAWFGFLTVQMISDMNWKFAAPVIKEARDAIEAGWDKEQAGVEAGYKAALECGGLEAAREYLTGYTCAQAQKAWDWALDTLDELYYKRLRDDLYD